MVMAHENGKQRLVTNSKQRHLIIQLSLCSTIQVDTETLLFGLLGLSAWRVLFICCLVLDLLRG